MDPDGVLRVWDHDGKLLPAMEISGLEQFALDADGVAISTTYRAAKVRTEALTYFLMWADLSDFCKQSQIPSRFVVQTSE